MNKGQLYNPEIVFTRKNTVFSIHSIFGGGSTNFVDMNRGIV